MSRKTEQLHREIGRFVRPGPQNPQAIWSPRHRAIHIPPATSGETKNIRQQPKKMARENLQLMLFLNLIKLMELFPRQPEKVALYMQQSLLEVPGSEEEEPPPPPPVPPTP